MIKAVYPDGTVRHFMWINKKYGYVREKDKVLRYPLPSKTKKKKRGRDARRGHVSGAIS